MKLTDLIQTTLAAAKALPELIIREGADELIRIFVDFGKLVHLHYEGDEALKGYFHCLGSGICSYCRAGFKPRDYVLVPLYSVSLGCVAVLRMSNILEAYSLLSQIRKHLDDPEIAQKILIIKRPDKYKYVVESKSAGHHVHLGADQISAFMDVHAKGEVDLGSIFPRPTALDMQAVPSIALKLDILNGSRPHSPEVSPE